jgi:hypothetical protein
MPCLGYQIGQIQKTSRYFYPNKKGLFRPKTISCYCPLKGQVNFSMTQRHSLASVDYIFFVPAPLQENLGNFYIRELKQMLAPLRLTFLLTNYHFFNAKICILAKISRKCKKRTI